MQLKKNYSDCFGKEERKIFPQSVQEDKIKIHNTVSYKQTQKQERQQEGRKRNLNTQASFVLRLGCRKSGMSHITIETWGMDLGGFTSVPLEPVRLCRPIGDPPQPSLPPTPPYVLIPHPPTRHALALPPNTPPPFPPTCPHPSLQVCVSEEYMSHPRRCLAPLRATDFQTGRLAASVDLMPCFQC